MNILGNVGARMVAYVVLSALAGMFGFITFSHESGMLTVDVNAALSSGVAVSALLGVAQVFRISRKVPPEKR